MTSSRSYNRIIKMLLAAAIASILIIPHSEAKVSSGKVTLSGAQTESTLVKFAVSPSTAGKIDVLLTSYGMYENEIELKMHIYAEEEWPAVKRSTLCSQKIQMAQKSLPIVFDYKGMMPDTRPGKKKTDRAEIYTSRIQTEIENPPSGRLTKGKARKDRSRYFYFLVDDCSLERYNHDEKAPDIIFDATVLNGGDHLPADEAGIGFLLVLTLAFSGALALLLMFKLLRTIGGEVHVAIIVVIAACACNAASSLCELIHRSVFAANGVGSYSMDALSSHFEALSDSMVALILLSIGGGWTLPSDVKGDGLSPACTKLESGVSKLMKGVRNPAGSLIDFVSSGGASGNGTGGFVALSLILVHAGLAQWGRTFDDDFDTYHALEHPPGRALMFLRILLGLVFITGVGMIRSSGRCPPSLMTFLTKFGLVGLSYFASLPGVSLFCKTLPYYQRHQALHWGAAIVQGCSLASLTWLFIGNADASSYHRLSRVGKDAATDMTADLAASSSGRSSSFKFGKTKINID
eukprot:CAMPEP_0201686312 /NCGR_PEP_ID=MMETSP0578-20130828/809_1 /ASSEMBLY_ACC=CAM_ASM_000663 /TAXON_ID=267565 /ORGANISM="Skeletonema grethea, Strain CCMP 1804" /LENGTH=519 /DNA_ID=CAMNT_0048170359 /DNA_START=116 /DNA_END=1675 /DNA_ORIENTATION=-